MLKLLKEVSEMKSVMISIKPKWCELIANGKKTVEVRKTRPKLETPFKRFIYETQGKYDDMKECKTFKFWENRQKVIGEFICDEITGGFWISPFSDYVQNQAHLSYDEVCDYANGKPIFAWHISDLIIYDKPKELSEFRHCGVNYHFNPIINKPPQSWCYCGWCFGG